MQTKLILDFLRQVARNNDREWFHAHKALYDAAKADFEKGAAQAIARIAEFDPTVAHLTVKDVTYRFYRDTRFSPDKSPISAISAPISALAARSRCMGATTSIWSRVSASLPAAATGCPPIS